MIVMNSTENLFYEYVEHRSLTKNRNDPAVNDVITLIKFKSIACTIFPDLKVLIHKLLRVLVYELEIAFVDFA